MNKKLYICNRKHKLIRTKLGINPVSNHFNTIVSYGKKDQGYS